MKYNRRDFIKTGGMVMLGSIAVPSFLGGCAGSPEDKAAGISFALNHFGLSESDDCRTGERRGLCRPFL